MTRTGTGLIYALVLLGAPLLGPWVFFLVYAVLALLALNEFFTLAQLDGCKPLLPVGLILGIWPLISRFLYHQMHWSSPLIGVGTGLILLLFLVELFRDQEKPFLNISMSLLALAYIGVPFGILPELVYLSDASVYSPSLIALILLVIWVHDSGAYFTGIWLGKTPLFKRISPKKTWEGFAGGILLGSLAIWLMTLLIQDIPPLKLWAFGLTTMVFANFGDFIESMWKRSLGIKDSGKSLPGHGGWLDRLDSLLFAIPAVYLCLLLFG